MKSIGLVLAAFIALCSPALLCAQKAQTISAIKQSWSGGIAGRYGTRYTFTIEFSNFKKEDPLPDTIWVEQERILISVRDTAHLTGNAKRTHSGKTLRYEIQANTFHDERRQNPMYKDKDNIKAPKPYSGVALISYHYKGKEHFYEVKKITKVLPPLAYP